jgi:hypothetical protein
VRTKKEEPIEIVLSREVCNLRNEIRRLNGIIQTHEKTIRSMIDHGDAWMRDAERWRKARTAEGDVQVAVITPFGFHVAKGESADLAIDSMTKRPALKKIA